MNKIKTYFVYGAVALVTVWLCALLVSALMPSPSYFDFFGIVAERTPDGASVTIGWEAFVGAFIILPVILATVDHFDKKKSKK